MKSEKPVTCTSSRGTCYQIHDNNKPIVVLIHGLGLDQSMWRWQVNALSTSHTVLTYDLTGMGQSSLPTATPSLSLFSRQLLDLLDELGISHVAIAGFSLGGMIARRVAMDFPQRIEALAILNSAHKRDAVAHDAIQQRVYQAQKNGPQSTVEAALSRWFTEPFREENPHIMNWVRITILANDKEIYPKNYQVLVDGVNELIAPEPPISCPALVMTGDEDFGNSPAMSTAISKEIPGSKLVILPGLRHMAMVEASELFNKHLLEFLNGVERVPVNG